MLKSLMMTLKRTKSEDEEISARRRYPRRDCDQCVSVIHGRNFPIENWSPTGVLLGADERLFSVGQDIEVTMKFKLRNIILDITHEGTVLRKGHGRVAISFKPLTQTTKHDFQKVIDDYAAIQFADSQAG